MPALVAVAFETGTYPDRAVTWFATPSMLQRSNQRTSLGVNPDNPDAARVDTPEVSREFRLSSARLWKQLRHGQEPVKHVCGCHHAPCVAADSLQPRLKLPLREMGEGARLGMLVKIRNLMRGLDLTPADLGLVTAPKRRGRPRKNSG